MANAFTRPTPAPTMPLPHRLAAKVAKDAAAYERLLDRYAAVAAREAALEREIAEARVEDAEQARRAVAHGKPVPEATTNAKLAHLDDLARERAAVLEASLASRAAELLEAARPRAQALAGELEREAVDLDAEGVEALQTAQRLFDAAAARRGESGWLPRASRSAGAARATGQARVHSDGRAGESAGPHGD